MIRTFFFYYSKYIIQKQDRTHWDDKNVSYPVSIINYIIISGGEWVHASMKEGGGGRWGGGGVHSPTKYNINLGFIKPLGVMDVLN